MPLESVAHVSKLKYIVHSLSRKEIRASKFYVLVIWYKSITTYNFNWLNCTYMLVIFLIICCHSSCAAQSWVLNSCSKLYGQIQLLVHKLVVEPYDSWRWDMTYPHMYISLYNFSVLLCFFIFRFFFYCGCFAWFFILILLDI